MEKRSSVLSMIDQIFDVQFKTNEKMSESLYVGLSGSAFKSIYQELDNISRQLEKHQLRSQIEQLISEAYACWAKNVLQPIMSLADTTSVTYDQTVLHLKLLLFVV